VARGSRGAGRDGEGEGRTLKRVDVPRPVATEIVAEARRLGVPVWRLVQLAYRIAQPTIEGWRPPRRRGRLPRLKPKPPEPLPYDPPEPDDAFDAMPLPRLPALAVLVRQRRQRRRVAEREAAARERAARAWAGRLVGFLGGVRTATRAQLDETLEWPKGTGDRVLWEAVNDGHVDRVGIGVYALGGRAVGITIPVRHRVLLALLDAGSVADVAARTGLPRLRAKDEVKRLRREGLATRLAERLYVLTVEGVERAGGVIEALRAGRLALNGAER